MPVYAQIMSGFRALVLTFFRYLIAGGAGFLLDYSIFALCYEVFGWNYLVSATLGFVAGLILVYITSNKWVFSSRRMAAHQTVEFLVFTAIGLVGLGLTVLFMWLFTDVLGVYPLISKLLTTALVLLWNFFARKLILY